MTNAQMTANFAIKLIRRITHRMEAFGDTYAKAKSVISIESSAGPKCWAIVDAHFAI